MATVVLQYLLLILSSSSVILFSTPATAAAATVIPPFLPNFYSSPSNHHHRHSSSSPNFSAILSSLNFHQLSNAGNTLSNITTAITIFAPSDSSLLTCPTCSLTLLLLEHSVPGLYPLHLLRMGTKIKTLAFNRCLSIKSSGDKTTAFFPDAGVLVGGLEITRPNLYNDGRVIVHGIQGYVTHLSPQSCDEERMSFQSLFRQFRRYLPLYRTRLRQSVIDAVTRLNLDGGGDFGFLSLAMRAKLAELQGLKSLTIFALNDTSITSNNGGGYAYVSNLMLHFVPNQRLMAADLIKLPVNSTLPTMEGEEDLVVTVTGGDGGSLAAPMRINDVEITRPDLVHDSRIVVHGVSAPLQRNGRMEVGFYDVVKRVALKVNLLLSLFRMTLYVGPIWTYIIAYGLWLIFRLFC